jgi:hypothetical protein
MEWMLAVLVLTLFWWFLRQRRPPTAEPQPLPDPRELLAEELKRAAETARSEGRQKEAQLLALTSAWLKTSPKLGDDSPPQTLDPNETRHLRLAGELWSKYGSMTPPGDTTKPQLQSASMLPYPKEAITRALEMLIDIGEGKVSSVHVDPGEASQEVLDEMRTALDRLRHLPDIQPENPPNRDKV